MKKLVNLVVVLMCLMLVGCGAKEDKEIASNDVNESVEVMNTSDEPAELEDDDNSFETAEGDLSVFGELVDDLFVLSSDSSKRISKEDAFEYLQAKGYSFYWSETDSVDDTLDLESAYELSNTFYLKPSYVTDYCGDVDNSCVSVVTVNGYVTAVQFKLEACEEQTINEIRNYFIEVSESSLFDEYETEVTVLGDADDWGMLSFEFYEQPLAENESQDAYAEIVVHPNGTLISFVLYD